MTLFRSAFAALALTASSLASAAYPERPINLIVPFPAGAGTDLTARTLAACMERYIDGAKIVVVNRAGASGDIGLGALAQSAPDGYTLGIVNTPGVISIPIERQTRYTLESFDFIANVVDDPGTISVHADSAIHAVQDLVAAARAKPGTITVGTQGVGSAGHISVLLLEQAAGVRFSSVPFQGASPSRTALLGKVIDSSTANLGEALTFAEGQPWRILGVMSGERAAQAPTLQTFKEAGYDLRAGSMRGLAGPKGIPAPILDRLSGTVKQCSEDTDFRERARKTFQPLRYLSREAYVAELRHVDAQLRALWQTHPWNR